MKQKTHPLDRLLRSAAAPPPRQDEAAAVPWTLEQRVLAALRGQRQPEDIPWLAPLLRQAFAAAGALAIVVGFLAFHSPDNSVTGFAPATHELAVMDQELTLALVPTDLKP
jgi:hypothetical protein